MKAFLIRRSFAYFETLIANNVLPAQGMDNAEALNALVSGLSKKFDTLRSELDNLAVVAKEPSACKVVFSPPFVLKTNQKTIVADPSGIHKHLQKHFLTW